MDSNPNRGKGNDSPLPCEPENSSSNSGLLCYGRWGCILPSFVSSDPTARAVFEHQIRDGIDLQIEISPSPYVHAEIRRIFQKISKEILVAMHDK
jgi:hypothetical protein